METYKPSRLRPGQRSLHEYAGSACASSTGARLSLPSILGIPELFELRAFGQTHRVKVSRRGARYIAVRFVAPLPIMPHA